MGCLKDGVVANVVVPAPALREHTAAVALLDRLLHHAVTVVTSGDSYA